MLSGVSTICFAASYAHVEHIAAWMRGVSTICFTASYAVALALEISRLLFRSSVRRVFMLGFATAGLLAHTAFLYYRALKAFHEGVSPLSSEKDWYLVAAWVLVAVYLYFAVLRLKRLSACSCCRWRWC